MKLYEQYRPKVFADIVGQTEAIRQIQTVLRRGWGGQVFWLHGASGTGKTTLAKIIAHMGALPLCSLELDGGELTPNRIDELERESSDRSIFIGADGWAYIINEAHGLRKDTIRRLLVYLERQPEHVVWIFTTTQYAHEHFLENDKTGDVYGPLMSRCIQVELSRQSQELVTAFAEHVYQIAIQEDLNGKSLEAYVELAWECESNCRMMLQAVESGKMLGKTVKKSAKRKRRT